jgi:hypothetical protein
MDPRARIGCERRSQQDVPLQTFSGFEVTG